MPVDPEKRAAPIGAQGFSGSWEGAGHGAATLLLTFTGADRPGVAAQVLDALADHRARLLDVEQVVIRGLLVLGVLIDVEHLDEDAVRHDAQRSGAHLGLTVTASSGHDEDDARRLGRLHVTVLGEPLDASGLATVAHALAEAGANIDRITRLARYPVTCLELDVSVAYPEPLRAVLSAASARTGLDIAVQPSGLLRRAKRLVVLDVDSTLLQDEVIDLLGERAGVGAEITRITAEAMAGHLPFGDALRQRVRLLAGQPATLLDDVRQAVRLTPGARTLVRTLKRLDHSIGIVSGGFREITDGLVSDLGLDYAAANALEIVDGRLTGELVGPIIDRAGKAGALRRFAAAAGVPLDQTVAIGDGANDVDMLAAAGLGVAFNAKPVLRERADASVSVPFLDAVLFLLGIPRAEIEAADAADPP
jgi:phosphoserine phosphatase